MIEVVEFINNFKKGWNAEYLERVFTKGNCYHFSVILKNIFYGDILYDPIQGHFITKIESKYYDITGEIDRPKIIYIWDNMKLEEPDQYKNIMMNCVYKK